MNPEELDRTFAGTSVLITGGLGFIGSNVARRLVRAGANVTLVDSLIPEYGGNLQNIDGIEDDVRVNISDVRDPFSLKFLVGGQDYLFNLAGQTSHLDSMTDPLSDLEINCRAQLHILESCRNHNPNIVVTFASTRQFYGRPHYLPVDEQHPLLPTDVNGVNKLAGEWYHRLYHDVHGVRSAQLRLTNTYGPGMRIKDARQTFLGVWLKHVLLGTSFEVWGGDQLRDFTFVDDCVEALLLVAADPRAHGKVYNLGGSQPLSLVDLADCLVEVAGQGSYQVRQFPEDRKKIDIGSFYSDFEMIREELGWEPKTSLEDGLRRTLEYFGDRLHHYL